MTCCSCSTLATATWLSDADSQHAAFGSCVCQNLQSILQLSQLACSTIHVSQLQPFLQQPSMHRQAFCACMLPCLCACLCACSSSRLVSSSVPVLMCLALSLSRSWRSCRSVAVIHAAVAAAAAAASGGDVQGLAHDSTGLPAGLQVTGTNDDDKPWCPGLEVGVDSGADGGRCAAHGCIG